MDALEIALNEARAELQFFRIALQVFYLNIAGRSERPLDMLRQMRDDVTMVLEKLPVEPQTASGDQRMKAMTRNHADRFFAQLETHLVRMTPEAGSWPAN